jgi:predicted phage terminase large subunit-like protein
MTLERDDHTWRANLWTYANYLSDGRWKPYKWLRKISYLLQDVALQRNGRFILNMPSRHGKTWLIKWLCAWYLEQHPDQFVMYVGYNDEFGRDRGREVKNISLHPDVAIDLAPDSQAANRWNTQQEGGMIATGIGGALTGRGCHLGVIDDPFKNWEESQSATIRRKVIEWFQGTFWDRREPGATVIVIMTRWHPNDLTGYLQHNGWSVLNLPDLAEPDDPLGREPGEPLVRERYDVDDIAEVASNMSPRMYQAKWKGNPSLPEGDIWKRVWWRHWKSLPTSFDLVVDSWDLALSTEPKSFVVGTKWGRAAGKYYLIAERRGQWDLDASVEEMHALQAMEPRPKWGLVENAALGPTAVKYLRDMNRTRWKLVAPKGSKVIRAESAGPLIKKGKVYLPPFHRAWVEDFIDECALFPAEPNDRVDSTSQYLKWVMPKKSSNRTVLVTI